MAPVETGGAEEAAPHVGDAGPLVLGKAVQVVVGQGADTVSPGAEPIVPPRPERRRRRRNGVGGRLFLLGLLFALAWTLFAWVGRPIQLPEWAVAEVEQRLNVALDGALPQGALAVGGIEVTVGDDWVPHLALQDLRLLKPGGQTLLTLPETQLTLDPQGLVQGDLRAKSVRIVGARLSVRRDREGHFDLDFGAGAGGGVPGPQIDSLAALFGAVDRVFELPALAHLTNVDAEALTLTLTDLREGKTWEVGDGRLSLENRPGELAAELGMSLVAGGGTVAGGGDGGFDQGRGAGADHGAGQSGGRPRPCGANRASGLAGHSGRADFGAIGRDN